MKKISMFDLEDLRTKFALKHDYKSFKKTYKQNGMVNKNTGIFWDKKFKDFETIVNQDEMTKEKIDFIVSLLPKKRVKILDIGIGQGYLEQRLKQLDIKHEIYGFDISKKSIERANKNFEGKFELGDLLKQNKFYKKNFYDLAVAIEVIEHIPPTKIFNFYENVWNSLKNDGKFIISTPLNEGLRYSKINPSAHVRDFTIPILKTELKLAGFKLKTIKTHYAFKNFYELKKFISKFIRRWQPNNVIIAARKTNKTLGRRGRDSNSR